MLHRPLAVAALTAASLLAQNPSAPPSAAAPAPAPAPAPAAVAPALPAAGSREATALLEQAIAKMKAYGRGTFATTESSDSAFLRAANVGVGAEDVEVTGGWQRDVVWAEADGKEYVRANGRMAARVDGQWKLRGSKLPGGRPVPFTVDPDLLFTVLGELPTTERKVAHVEAATVGGKPVALLSLVLEGGAAKDLAQSGALPLGDGGGMVMFAGLGGGMELPENDYTVHLALAVDPAGGDLLRLHAKVFEQNPMMGNMTIQVAGGFGGGGGGGGDEDDEEEEEAKAAKEPGAAVAAPQWKQGFPVRKPAKGESVTTYRVDFRKLGLAEPPALDDKAKALLRVQ